MLLAQDLKKFFHGLNEGIKEKKGSEYDELKSTLVVLEEMPVSTLEATLQSPTMPIHRLQSERDALIQMQVATLGEMQGEVSIAANLMDEMDSGLSSLDAAAIGSAITFLGLGTGRIAALDATSMG